jgi:hypothetical protein
MRDPITVAVVAALAQFVLGHIPPLVGGQTMWVAPRICLECRRYDFIRVVLHLISSSVRLAHADTSSCYLRTFKVRNSVLRLIPNRVVLPPPLRVVD